MACAEELLEVVPLIMRALRAEVRRRKAQDLSVPQFRALAFVGRNDAAKLSDLANFLGLTAPSASKLVDGLVAAKLIERTIPLGDRRRVSLTLSRNGRREYQTILKHARTFLAAKVRHLASGKRQRLFLAMRDLRDAFENQPAEVAHFVNGVSERMEAKGTAAVNHHG